MVKSLIVAGPCSAESQSQVLKIADDLHKIGITHYRAGLWKPRTSPNSFEGVGKVGIPWLQQIQKTFNMSVGTEVANKEHIISAVNGGLDFLWIGARSVTNPFAIQDIADALKKLNIDIPIFVKNPVIPDVKLWIGAFDRLRNAGITKLFAVHRGFNIDDHSYRNSPQWQVPIEFKRLNPDVKILCDPSHISGDSRLVEEIIFKASRLNFDGLMVEVHNNPKMALSDANQQITPDMLSEILQKIDETDVGVDSDELSIFREQMDELDKILIDTIARRMDISHKIGVYKKRNNVSVLQSDRYYKVLNNAIKYGKDKSLDSVFIKQIFELIHQKSIDKQF